MGAILNSHNLSVGYKSAKGETRVLSNINIELKSNSLVCLMGPNGAGKSTLIRTIAGLQPPLGGTVKIEGKDISTISRHELATKISLVLTDKPQVGNLNVLDIIRMGRFPHTSWFNQLTTSDTDTVDKVVDQCGLKTLLPKKLYELSDGQLQKVFIARALAQDGPVLILDEPTAHLDLNNRVEVMNLLKSLAQNTGKAILIATHELDLALQTADELWLTKANAAIVTGVPEDMVLNGAIDEAFDMKGFDLKSGRITRATNNGKRVRLVGDSYQYLWTKNALERNGFIASEGGEIVVDVAEKGNHFVWALSTGKSCESIAELIEILNSHLFSKVNS